MAQQFNNTPPEWREEGTEPTTELQNNGFTAGYKPPAQYFNYLFHKYTECIKELQTLASAQGVTIGQKANSADLADVATSGSYNDLEDTPTIPTVDAALSSTSTNAVQNKAVKTELDKKANSNDLATVATSGSYEDLENKPTIPEGVVVDAALSSTSTNPVQNKVIKSAIDGIEVGGRNYILGSNTKLATPNDSIYLDLSSDFTNEKIQGKKICLSLEYGLDSLKWLSGTSSYKRLGISFTITYTDNSKQYIENFVDISTAQTMHKRINTFFTLKNKGIKSIGKFGMYFQATTVEGSGYIAKPKLEIANKATDWTQAPEDVASKELYGGSTINVGRKTGTTIGDCSSAIGALTTASGSYSHAEGSSTTASGDCSHAEGISTTALTNQHAQGHFNNTTTATDNSLNGTSNGTAFVIGNGTNVSSSNAFRVTGKGYVYATNATVQTGADYAEYFEWSDGNPENEDRVGLFVTFDESAPEKIMLANNDDYILGIVSGMPSVIGNGDEDWKKRYVLDNFGRYIQETFEYEEEGETKTGTKWKENPEYDSTKPYVSREERAEWSAIGIVGVLSVYDDGTCQVNGYCKCRNNGVATAAEKGADTYRVLKRVTDNIVKVLLK